MAGDGFTCSSGGVVARDSYKRTCLGAGFESSIDSELIGHNESHRFVLIFAEKLERGGGAEKD